jgi:hypothetical protein
MRMTVLALSLTGGGIATMALACAVELVRRPEHEIGVQADMVLGIGLLLLIGSGILCFAWWIA